MLAAVGAEGCLAGPEGRRRVADRDPYLQHAYGSSGARGPAQHAPPGPPRVSPEARGLDCQLFDGPAHAPLERRWSSSRPMVANMLRLQTFRIASRVSLLTRSGAQHMHSSDLGAARRTRATLPRPGALPTAPDSLGGSSVPGAPPRTHSPTPPSLGPLPRILLPHPQVRLFHRADPPSASAPSRAPCPAGGISRQQLFTMCHQRTTGYQVCPTTPTALMTSCTS